MNLNPKILPHWLVLTFHFTNKHNLVKFGGWAGALIKFMKYSSEIGHSTAIFYKNMRYCNFEIVRDGTHWDFYYFYISIMPIYLSKM